MLSELKTATVTWISYYNFGSYLQAYALQTVLKALGVQNVIIDDSRIVFGYKQTFLGKVGIKIFRICNYIKGNNREYILSKECFERFKRKYLILDNRWNDTSDLSNKYDLFIAGSDQIWFPDAQVFNPFYYLYFTDKKKISYAASIGVSKYPNSYKGIVKDLLESYSYISVRERNGVELLKSFIQKDIINVLDPTLLLNEEDWDKVASKQIIREKKYALCYMLTLNDKYMDYIYNDCKLKGLKLLILSGFNEYRKYADIIVSAGPSEFISIIKYASFIYTDSYHCTIFSILYRKDFVTFKRFKEEDKRNQNSRLLGLFDLIGIKGRFISENELTIPFPMEKVNYDKVFRILEKEKKDSMNYIINALSL